MFRRARIYEVRRPAVAEVATPIQARSVTPPRPAPKLATATLEAVAAQHERTRGKRGRKGG